jgi:hypothetical protein
MFCVFLQGFSANLAALHRRAFERNLTTAASVPSRQTLGLNPIPEDIRLVDVMERQ